MSNLYRPKDVSLPVLDKAEFVINLKNQTTDAIRKEVFGRFTQVQKGLVHGDIVDSARPTKRKHKKKQRFDGYAYKSGMCIVIDDLEVDIFVCPKHAKEETNQAIIWVGFNPAHSSPESLEALKVVLGFIAGVSQNDALNDYVTFKRVDIAFDVENLAAANVLAICSKIQLYSVIRGKGTGDAETHYVGSKGADFLCRLYNKLEQLEQVKGVKRLSYKEETRIELVFKRRSWNYNQLFNLYADKHFQNLGVYHNFLKIYEFDEGFVERVWAEGLGNAYRAVGACSKCLQRHERNKARKKANYSPKCKTCSISHGCKRLDCSGCDNCSGCSKCEEFQNCYKSRKNAKRRTDTSLRKYRAIPDRVQELSTRDNFAKEFDKLRPLLF